MKKKISPFLAGFLSAALLMAIPAAYAANAWTKTIEVGSINIMVNGKEFHPTDPNGNPVDVFVYNGTTYAPLRALAEAYGLTVGYDSAKNMATVTAANNQKAPNLPESYPYPTLLMYNAFPDVPDFGPISGAPMSKMFPKDGDIMYLYSSSEFDPDSIITYCDILLENGFSYIGSFPGSAGISVLVYSNGVHSVSVGVFDEEYLAIMVGR